MTTPQDTGLRDPRQESFSDTVRRLASAQKPPAKGSP